MLKRFSLFFYVRFRHARKSIVFDSHARILVKRNGTVHHWASWCQGSSKVNIPVPITTAQQLPRSISWKRLKIEMAMLRSVRWSAAGIGGHRHDASACVPEMAPHVYSISHHQLIHDART